MRGDFAWLRRVGRWARAAVGGLSSAYLVAVPLLIFWIFPMVGELNPLVAAMLYAPRVLWFLPTLVAVPVLWLLGGRKRASFGLLALLVTLPFGFGMQWHRGAEASEGDVCLRIAGYNRGQHRNQSFQPFLKEVLPDVVVMQDAARRGANYRRSEDYARFGHIEDLGEFVILSCFPILERDLIFPEKALPGTAPRKRRRSEGGDGMTLGPPPIAARFVIELGEGTEVSVYNVHTLTVRERLRSYAWGRCLVGVLGVPGTPWADDRKEEASYWQARMDQLCELAERVGNDPNPTVIVGDFNVPTGGRTYRKLLEFWREAHDEAGWGAGYSFPGVTRNPLSLGGPWMRLDHVFFDQHWEALASVTEEGRRSQHRGVFASLRLGNIRGQVFQ